MEENFHVLPVNDLHDHKDTGFDCKCNPKLQKQEDGTWLIVHRSYDRREDNESGAVTKSIKS